MNGEKRRITQRTVAANIRRILTEKGLVQRVMAERAELTPQQFCDILNGRKIIRVENIAAIADVLGVEIGELFAAERDAG